MTTLDKLTIEEYLDNAQLHAAARNDWAEGYWIGRAVEQANQNAIDHEWLIAELDRRGLDSGVVRIPKPGDPDPMSN